MRLADDARGWRQAAELLARGKLVALPTETVYGLAGDARQPTAIRAIYRLKGRPESNPLIVHLSAPGQAGDHGVMGPHARALAGRFWPGPLTLVVERRRDGLGAGLAEGAGAGLATVAMRCPDVNWTAHIPGPLVMPSANLSGHVSPTTPAHVWEDFPDLPVVDAGPCPGGIESTVVRVDGRGATMLRTGAVTAEAIGALVPLVPLADGERAGSPGLLLRHYAPAKPLRLEARARRTGEWWIGFGEVAGDANLSPVGDLKEAARNLYAALRLADRKTGDAIAVAPVPEVGLGVAINDRLRRAAKGR